MRSRNDARVKGKSSMATEGRLNRYEYDRLVHALVTMKECPFAGKVTADLVKMVLGEYADIWPPSIYDDVPAQPLLGELGGETHRGAPN